MILVIVDPCPLMFVPPSVENIVLQIARTTGTIFTYHWYQRVTMKIFVCSPFPVCSCSLGDCRAPTPRQDHRPQGLRRVWEWGRGGSLVPPPPHERRLVSTCVVVRARAPLVGGGCVSLVRGTMGRLPSTRRAAPPATLRQMRPSQPCR